MVLKTEWYSSILNIKSVFILYQNKTKYKIILFLFHDFHSILYVN